MELSIEQIIVLIIVLNLINSITTYLLFNIIITKNLIKGVKNVKYLDNNLRNIGT